MASTTLFMVTMVGVVILGIGPSEATTTTLTPEGKVKYEFAKVYLNLFDDYLGFFEGNVTMSKKKQNILTAMGNVTDLTKLHF